MLKALQPIALGALLACPQYLLAQANTDVPVAKVVLFSSGVGYFEHAGLVRGNSATQLRFRTAQINDILKSIMLQDQDGGRVGAISYPSQDPLAKTLKSFQVDITSNPSQADLLNQLRGARVNVQTRAGTFSGTILGVESQRRAGDKGDADAVVQILNLLTGATMRAIELSSVTSLSLEDAALQEELTKALSALVQARDQDKKPVTINFTGSGDRRVRIGYVVETPIWKTSYRLMLNAKGTGGHLQGWAIVENQTESDWNNVSLALVSGRPISFQMDLYQPLYSTRPTVAQELFGNVRPQVYAGGIQLRGMSTGTSSDSAARIRQNLIGRVPGVQLNEVVVTATEAAGEYGSFAGNGAINVSTVQSLAQAAKLGELFQYTVPNVTLGRQKSAMLPIITDSVELERVSIYNSSVLATNPLNGVLFKNTSGKHLLQGPVTVLDGGGYAGDARIDNVPPGQSRLLSYGIDLDMTVIGTGHGGASTVTSARINKGILTLTRKVVSSRLYTADNKSDKAKVLVVEHPRMGSGKLVNTQDAFETTPTHYRFKINVGANKVSTLIVNEEDVRDETVALLPMDAGTLAYYTRTGEMSAAVRDGLGKAIQLKQSMVELDRQIGVATQQVNDITVEQGRIRENMKTVEKAGAYYERMLAKLNEQESQIEKLQADRRTLTARRDATRRELEDYLNTLSIS